MYKNFILTLISLLMLSPVRGQQSEPDQIKASIASLSTLIPQGLLVTGYTDKGESMQFVIYAQDLNMQLLKPTADSICRQLDAVHAPYSLREKTNTTNETTYKYLLQLTDNVSNKQSVLFQYDKKRFLYALQTGGIQFNQTVKTGLPKLQDENVLINIDQLFTELKSNQTPKSIQFQGTYKENLVNIVTNTGNVSKSVTKGYLCTSTDSHPESVIRFIEIGRKLAQRKQANYFITTQNGIRLSTLVAYLSSGSIQVYSMAEVAGRLYILNVRSQTNGNCVIPINWYLF